MELGGKSPIIVFEDADFNFCYLDARVLMANDVLRTHVCLSKKQFKDKFIDD